LFRFQSIKEAFYWRSSKPERSHPPVSHRTVREPFDSYGSCYSELISASPKTLEIKY